MSEAVKPIAEWSALGMETVGVLIIVGLALYSLVVAGIGILKKHETDMVLLHVRQRLGRGILLGLEFLIAADIIHTVAVDLSFTTVGVLAIVVLIRTFLSFTLEVELTGRWPWQNKSE